MIRVIYCQWEIYVQQLYFPCLFVGAAVVLLSSKHSSIPGGSILSNVCLFGVGDVSNKAQSLLILRTIIYDCVNVFDPPPPLFLHCCYFLKIQS